ncbi:hypothetical protein [Daejeonella sp.]
MNRIRIHRMLGGDAENDMHACHQASKVGQRIHNMTGFDNDPGTILIPA